MSFAVTAIVLVVVAVLLIELINTSLGSGSLLCACVERMALGADFDVDLRLCLPEHPGPKATGVTVLCMIKLLDR